MNGPFCCCCTRGISTNTLQSTSTPVFKNTASTAPRGPTNLTPKSTHSQSCDSPFAHPSAPLSRAQPRHDLCFPTSTRTGGGIDLRSSRSAVSVGSSIATSRRCALLDVQPLQDSERSAVALLFHRSLRVLCIILAPFVPLFCGLGHDLVEVLFDLTGLPLAGEVSSTSTDTRGGS